MGRNGRQEPEMRSLAEYVRSNRVLVVCLDTNIYELHHFRLDLLERIDAICRRRGDCVVVVPNVILLEAHSQYHRQVEQTLGGGQLPRPAEVEAEAFVSDLKACYETYWCAWEERARAIGEVVALDLDLANKAVERAIRREPPCYNGEQIRDAIAWLTFLRRVQALAGYGVFVSHDTHFDTEKHADLRREATGAGVVLLRSFSELEQSVLDAFGGEEVAEPATTTRPGLSFHDHVSNDRLVITHEPEVLRAVELYVSRAVPGYQGGFEILEARLVDRLVRQPKATDGIKSCDVEEGWNLELYFEVEERYTDPFAGQVRRVSGTMDAEAMVTAVLCYSGPEGEIPTRVIKSTKISGLQWTTWPLSVQ